ncbi:hypothetical protein MMC30_006294 [Trapelia coarctata]|nr:hypothetical protein [Trapelia coarctata]
MAQQDSNTEEHANGMSTEAEPEPDAAPTTPSSNPESISMLQSTSGQPPSSVANTSPMTNRDNGRPPNNQSDQSELIGDPKMPLDGFDWADLEKRYHDKMDECRETENEICEEFGKWVRVFEAWASTTIHHENERSIKRLKTRMRYVHGAEERLEKKRQHYSSVVKAFESALALLGPS